LDTLNTWKNKLLADGSLTDFNAFDSLYLLRFLRARKFDIEKSHLMFSNFLKWRVDNNADDIEVFLI